MQEGIKNKVVLITGGSTGIGAEMARLPASQGAKVAIAARRKERLDEVVTGIEAAGGTARAYSLDVTDKKQGTVYSATKFAVSAISEGLRQEVGDKIRVTSIAPGAVESDLKHSTSGTARETVLQFYETAIPAASVARAIAFAIEQPPDVDINEIVLRPTAQAF
jgi:NADP-dependent 3-hydroxy acid dehydrogenase YdfG